MKLKDLKQGMIGKLRDGDLITILVYGDYHKSNFARIHSLYDYSEDLTHKENKLFDIMEVSFGDKVIFRRKESRWFVPEVRKEYFFTNSYGGIISINNTNSSDDIDIFNNKKVFKTIEEAEKRVEQLQATLSVERWIAENDVEVDVLDEDVVKFYLYYSVEDKEFGVLAPYTYIYMPKQFVLSSHEKAKQLIKEREKELKIMFGVEE